MRNAIRALLRDRAYTAVALATLAFGIAVNTIIFSLVNGVLLRPLAWRDAGQLVVIHEIVPEMAAAYPLLPVNARHFFEWRDRSTSFAQLGLISKEQLVLTRAGEPEQVSASKISAEGLSLLGVQPQLGRNFLEEEERPGHERVAVIGDALWDRKFHRDPALVGRAIMLDGSPYTVVGILPASFQFPKPESQMWGFPRKSEIFIPFAMARDREDWLGDFNYTVIGRLKPGVSIARARAEMNVLQASIATHFPEKLHLLAAITGLQDEIVGPVRKGLLILFGAVGAVLLIVCVNLANLTLARAAGCGRDLAIRAALGAGRWQLVRYILTESVCIGMLGGAAGVLLAWLGLDAVLRYAPVDLPRVEDVHLDARVLLFGLGLAILTGLLVGILPAWRASSADPQESLRASSHTLTEGRRAIFTRDLLVGLESALSAVLLIAAGLMMGSFVRLLHVNKGFDADRLIAFEINLPAGTYGDAKQREPYYRRLIAKLQAIPGVTSAGLVSHLPLEGEDWGDVIRHPGDKRPWAELPAANYRFCSPDYFRTMGIPLTAGSSFTEADRNRNLALISEEAAREVWPGENPVGKKFGRMDDQEAPFEVVGVVRDVRSGMADKPGPTVYVPYWYRSRLAMEAVLRTPIDPGALAPSVRSAVWSTDPDSVVGEVRTMQHVASDSVGRQRFQMRLIAGFAASALLLACIGIYGVLSWSVSRRRNEIGIRMALGAHASDVHRLVMAQALRPVLFGLAAGVAAALALGRVLSSVLFGVSAHDPLTIAVVVAVLGAVAALACYIPSRRAALIDPLEALRYE
ncbi:MAG: ABC transporter permease [Bryobacteraceae bacterium]